MQTEQPSGLVLPNGWLRTFLDRADLARSFEELEGSSHFHAETMRGRIRSLELELDAAKSHFRRASAESEEAPQTIPNQVRKLVLHSYWFESSLLEAPLSMRPKPPKFEAPHFSQDAHENFPEIRFSVNLRTCAEGLLRLHAGDWTDSARMYRQLIDDNQDAPGPVRAGYFLGLAASQQNLGQIEEAKRNFENAGLFVALEGATLNRLTVASALYASYVCLGDEESATSWLAFLERLDCPRATKVAFIKRAGILIERWRVQATLLVL